MNAITQLAIKKIVADARCQMRVGGVDFATRDSYREDLDKGDVFPPVTVFYDGRAYWLAGGFTRLAAHVLAGRKYIDADVRPGGLREAMLFAVGENITHGLRRSNEDKRRAVATLLHDAEWSAWSAKKIGRLCGVDDKTVAAVRLDLSAEFPRLDAVTVERNGAIYTLALPRQPPPDPAALRAERLADAAGHCECAEELLALYPDRAQVLRRLVAVREAIASV